MNKPKQPEDSPGEEDASDPLSSFSGQFQRRRQTVETSAIIDEEHVQTLVNQVMESHKKANATLDEKPAARHSSATDLFWFLRFNRWMGMGAVVVAMVVLLFFFPRGGEDAKALIHVEFALVPTFRSKTTPGDAGDMSLALSEDSIEINQRSSVRLIGPPAKVTGETLHLQAAGKNESGQTVEFVGEASGLAGTSDGSLASIDWSEALVKGDFRVGTNKPTVLRFKFLPAR